MWNRLMYTVRIYTLYMYIYMYVYMYVYIYVCMYVYIYIFTHGENIIELPPWLNTFRSFRGVAGQKPPRTPGEHQT